jgi:hypothetical protein
VTLVSYCALCACITADQEDYDGTLLPTDFKQAGQIRDTELARLMVHGLPPGVVLHALFDSCHSGDHLMRSQPDCWPGMHDPSTYSGSPSSLQ